MSTMKTRNKYIYDAAPAVLLRAVNSAPLTATGLSTVLSLDALNTAYWDNNEIPVRELSIAIVVTACDFTTGDETYVVSAEVAASAAFTTAYTVASQPILGNTGVGAYSLVLDMDSVFQLGVRPTHIRLRMTLAGTTPSITYAAWLAQGSAS